MVPPLQPQVEFFSNEVMIHPVTNRPEHKRSFIPSLVEKQKVSKLVHAIKMGWIKPRRVEDDSKGNYYDLWAGEDSSILAKHRMHLPAPKTPLPGHHESYNPPPEYLLTDEEVGGPIWTVASSWPDLDGSHATSRRLVPVSLLVLLSFLIQN